MIFFVIDYINPNNDTFKIVQLGEQINFVFIETLFLIIFTENVYIAITARQKPQSFCNIIFINNAKRNGYKTISR